MHHLHWLQGPDGVGSGAGRGGIGGKSACPKGIFDLMCSKACRSAIMFGDELTEIECVQLVGKLAGCEVSFDFDFVFDEGLSENTCDSLLCLCSSPFNVVSVTFQAFSCNGYS